MQKYLSVILILLSCLLCSPAILTLADAQDKKPAQADVGTSEPRKEPIYGTWLLPDQHDGGVTFQTKLSFYQSQKNDSTDIVHETVTCSWRLKQLQAQAEALVKTTKNDITILEKAFSEKHDGDVTCQAAISPGPLHYVISADGRTMVLTKAGEPPTTLKRVLRSAGADEQ